jgi:putative intracellular protease/amidase
MAHRESPVPSLREHRPEAPAKLDALCLRMMAKRPEDRPQSMREVVAELKEVASELASASNGAAGVENAASLDYPNDTRLTFADGDFATPPASEAAEAASWARGETATAAASIPATLRSSLARAGSWLHGGRLWMLGVGGLSVAAILAMVWFWPPAPDSATAFRSKGAARSSDNALLTERSASTRQAEIAAKRPEGPPRVLFLLPQEGFWIPDYQPVRDHLRNAGVEIHLASSRRGTAGGRSTFEGGDTLEETIQLSAAEALDEIDQFDAVCVVGKPSQAGENEFAAEGAQAEAARRLLRTALDRGKIVASVCRGTVVLHGAGILAGRTVAQGRYIPEVIGDTSVQWRRDERVVRDGRLLTAADPPDASPLAERLLAMLREGASSPPP